MHSRKLDSSLNYKSQHSGGVKELRRKEAPPHTMVHGGEGATDNSRQCSVYESSPSVRKAKNNTLAISKTGTPEKVFLPRVRCCWSDAIEVGYFGTTEWI